MRHVFGALLMCSLTGCTTPAQPGVTGSVATSIQVATGSEFELSVGQEARVQGTSLRIRFDGVSQDSRCPQGVQCVWAGNAVVNLRITSANTSLTLNTGLEPKTAGLNSFTLVLVDLKPAARQGGVSATEYRAILEVRPR